MIGEQWAAVRLSQGLELVVGELTETDVHISTVRAITNGVIRSHGLHFGVLHSLIMRCWGAMRGISLPCGKGAECTGGRGGTRRVACTRWLYIRTARDKQGYACVPAFTDQHAPGRDKRNLGDCLIWARRREVKNNQEFGK